MDGKALRGIAAGGLPGAHLLAAYAPHAAAAVGRWRVDARANEHKAALGLLGVLPLRGRVVTADGMFTHRDVCRAVLDGGGARPKTSFTKSWSSVVMAFAAPAFTTVCRLNLLRVRASSAFKRHSRSLLPADRSARGSPYSGPGSYSDPA